MALLRVVKLSALDGGIDGFDLDHPGLPGLATTATVRLPRLLAPICPIRAGNVDSSFEHYIRHGIDENRYSLIRREVCAENIQWYSGKSAEMPRARDNHPAAGRRGPAITRVIAERSALIAAPSRWRAWANSAL
jgi:hypothetical protein